MKKVRHNIHKREEDICLLEQKWLALEQILAVFDEDELPDNIYEKLYKDRNKIEDTIPHLKPRTPGEIAAQLRIARSIYRKTWGPRKGEDRCPITENISNTLEVVIEMMEKIEQESKQILLVNNTETTQSEIEGRQHEI